MAALRISIVLLCVSFALACSSTNKRKIQKTAIDTEDARLTGYLEALQSESCSPLCTPLERQISVDSEAVLDEALLRKNDGEACFDVVVRTTLGYDVSIEELRPSCVIDGEVVAGEVTGEAFSVYEFRDDEDDEDVDGENEDGENSEFVAVVRDMTQQDLVEAAGQTTARAYYGNADDYTIDRLRTCERKATICCPGEGTSLVQLTLNNGVSLEEQPDDSEDSGSADAVAADPPAGIDFVWFIID